MDNRKLKVETYACSCEGGNEYGLLIKDTDDRLMEGDDVAIAIITHHRDQEGPKDEHEAYNLSGQQDLAAELVKRWNKYPDLLSQRDELADIVQELRLTLLDLGNREEFGGDAPEFNEGGDQYEALEKASAILSKLSQP